MYSPKEIAENFLSTGDAKTKMSISRMLVLGIMAGIFIGIAGVAATTAGVSIGSASVSKLVGAMIFPAGLAMVIIAGSELFTGNCLLGITVLAKRAKIHEVLRNWLFVYLGNLIGGILVGLVISYAHVPSLFGGELAEVIVSTAQAKATIGFGDAVLKGILCNFLVCIAVWMSFAATRVSGKILGMYFPVMIFVLCGFEHCVANMYYISAGLFTSSIYGIPAEGLTWGAFFVSNLLPVTLGNLIGGLLIGLVYWFCYLRISDVEKVAEEALQKTYTQVVHIQTVSHDVSVASKRLLGMRQMLGDNDVMPRQH